MALRKRVATTVRNLINRITGVSSNVNGARKIFRVNAGKSEPGTSTRLGNRDAKRRDLRAAFGLATG